MPNTLLEGMASGVPIISSNYGPMPEILGDCGLYFDPENVNSLITALSCFMDNPNRCLEMAADAQERAKLFPGKIVQIKCLIY